MCSNVCNESKYLLIESKNVDYKSRILKMLFQNKFYEQRLLPSAFKQITKSLSYVVEKAEQLYVPTLLTVRNRSKRKYLALDSMAVRVTQAWTCRTAHWPTTPLAACCTGGLQTAQTHWRRLHELRTYHCWGFFV